MLDYLDEPKAKGRGMFRYPESATALERRIDNDKRRFFIDSGPVVNQNTLVAYLVAAEMSKTALRMAAALASAARDVVSATPMHSLDVVKVSPVNQSS